MSEKIKILGIAGSLRQGSYNRSALRAAAELAPEGAEIESYDIDGFPGMNQDQEKDPPAKVTEFKAKIREADAILFVTPEYNYSVPGVLKNAIDWLSRPTADIKRVFGDRPVAVTGATPGRGGTALAQAAWLPVLRTLGTRPWFGGRLQVAEAGKVFDAEGRIVDERIQKGLREFIAGFAQFIEGAR